MADTRGVFSLGRAFTRSKKGTWVTPEQSFFGVPQGFDTGYNAGGATPGAVSITDKTTYTTDTTARVPGANINTGDRKGFKGCGSVNAGYYGGGFPASDTVNKMPYSTETMATIPSLYAARGYLSACSSELAGYWSGGAPGSNSGTDKCTFSTDTVARAPGANLSVARAFVNATGNTQFGFIGGGFLSPNYYSTMDKLSFGGDTVAQAPAASMTDACEDYNASGNGFFGYFAGGFGPGSTVHSRVDKCNFLVDTTGRIPGADLTQPVFKQGQTGTALAGYLSGGQTPARISTTQKLNYSTETTTTVPGAALSGTRSDTAASSSRDNGLSTLTQPTNLKGKKSFDYLLFGGGPGSLLYSSTIQKIDFATDSVSEVGNWTRSIDKGVGGSTDVAGYFGGPSTSVDKVPYATLTAVTVPGASPPNSIQYGCGIQNRDKMFFAAGNPTTTKVDKLTFATETGSATPANLTQTRFWPYNCSNPSFGYVLGSGPPTRSSIDKMTFATETVSLLTQNLSSARGEMGGSGNETDGYFAQGGQPNTSSVAKISYATDTVSEPASLKTTQLMAQGGQCGGGSFGYSFIGYNGGYVSNIHKINYHNDTVFLSPSKAIGTQRDPVQTSSQDYALPQPRPETPTLEVSYTQITTPFTGYFGGGGGPGGKTSNYYKLLFASETGSFLPSTHMATARSTDLGGFSDSTDGWTMGGYAGTPTFLAVSNTDRLTYASDTSVAVPGANLPGGGRYGGRQGCSTTAGYYVAGYGGGSLSSTLKMPFSTESQTITPGAALSSARYYFCGGGGTDKGYFGGGYDSGTPVTKFDKLVYSTDTMTASPASNLKIENTRSNSKACGDSRSLYFGGASSPATGLLDFGYKIPYNTDTSMLVGGFLFTPRTSAVSTGHELEGYYMGGEVPSPYVQLTTVDKINYATEVCSLVPTAFLPEHRGGGSNLGCRNMAASGGGTSNTL